MIRHTRTRLALLASGTLVAALLAACGAPAGSGAPGRTAAGGGPGATNPPGGAGATQVPGGGATATQVAAGPPSITDPCSLLTADDIELATGFRPIRELPHADTPGEVPSGCEWDLDNPGETPWAIVLGVRSPGGRALYDSIVASPVQAGEPVEGVGDAAQQNEPAVVDAVKGDTYISVTYMEWPERAEVPRELARLILEKV